MTISSAIIVAGGSGLRLGGDTPKQYLDLGGLAVIAWSARAAAASSVDELVVGAAPEWIGQARALLEACGLAKPFQVVEGGGVRQETVRRCLQAVRPDAEVVVIHDAARPFVSPGLIERALQAALKNQAATAAIPASDTIKLTDPMGYSENLPRDRLRLIQTPQAFQAALIREAHEQANKAGYLGTDDTSLVERLGHAPVLVDGDPKNLKITTAFDLDLARAIVAAGLAKPW